MKKTTQKKSLSRINENDEWIVLHEHIDGDPIFIKRNKIEAVERYRQSYDGKRVGDTAYVKDTCKLHSSSGKTYIVRENYLDIMKMLNEV